MVVSGFIHVICTFLISLALDTNAFLISNVKLSQSRSGVVQIEKDGQVGTICSDGFTLEDARVVCREAGFGQSGIAIPTLEHIYGPGTGKIHYNELGCIGNETTLSNCKHRDFVDCVHTEDVGVICDANGIRLQLENKDHGRLDVTINGQTGTVCNDYFDLNAAKVVCRQLGLPFQNAQYAKTRHVLGYNVPILLDDVRCSGTEDNILKCKMQIIGKNDCLHEQDVSVYCYAPVTMTAPTTTTSPTTTTVAVTTPKGVQSCLDDQRLNCDKSSCSTGLKTFCPLTCNLCNVTTPPPCKDNPVVNCNPKVCTDLVLKDYCKATCGICAGATTTWIHVTAVSPVVG
ncbi:neurotrypsin-like [Mytilus trossulus]|uniref:neurotrypsin-like n=1 Tax=Mytilus trossulus TaxID=6551 RepID=UPI003005A079